MFEFKLGLCPTKPYPGWFGSVRPVNKVSQFHPVGLRGPKLFPDSPLSALGQCYLISGIPVAYPETLRREMVFQLIGRLQTTDTNRYINKYIAFNTQIKKSLFYYNYF